MMVLVAVSFVLRAIRCVNQRNVQGWSESRQKLRKMFARLCTQWCLGNLLALETHVGVIARR